MTGWLTAAFLLAHGLLHPAVYATPADPDRPAPFDAGHSWLLSARLSEPRAHRAAVSWAWGAAVLYGAAALTVALNAGAGTALAMVAAAAGLTFKALWFHPWLTLGVAIDLAVLALASTGGLPGID